jgi:L,D-peptidoglycan transpeptidase YkuD (ErfK/YbiS/YcfS/YnhG family)
VTDLVVSRWGARFGARALPCAIGLGGIRSHKVEGDGATPEGRYALRLVYWRPDRLARPRTRLPVQPIGPSLGWSDDPADPLYNAACRLGRGFSAERMRRADRLYDLVVVTSHNEARRPGAGSAIFLHVRRGEGPRTAGCVAFRRDHLLTLLEAWDGGALVIGCPPQGSLGAWHTGLRQYHQVLRHSSPP